MMHGSMATRREAVHDRRALIFLLVLLGHSAGIWLAVRATRLVRLSSEAGLYQPLLLIPVERPKPSNGGAPTQPAAPPRVSGSVALGPGSGPPQHPAATPAQAHAAPQIDWDREAELAVQGELARRAHENGYRDLSALTSVQRDWIRRNHMEPAPPGLAWTHPRVDTNSGGLPIIWINDHCVIVPPLLVFVFCRIGHIEANGGLFEHMRDP